jgi:predicted DNA-binding transcriptional regulator YafY
MAVDRNDPVFQAIFVRLIYLDYKLSRDGVTVKEASRRWDVSTKTIRRDLDTIREMGGTLIEPMQGVKDAHVYQYADKSRRVFSEDIHREAPQLFDFD